MSRFVLLCCCSVIVVTAAFPVEEFLSEREKLKANGTSRSLGGNLILNNHEELVNSVLMNVKYQEYDRSVANLQFPPAIHFFQAKPLMLESKVFQFIRQMPKGIQFHFVSIYFACQ